MAMAMFKLRIIARNARARVEAGEDKETVLASYTTLTDAERVKVSKLMETLPE